MIRPLLPGDSAAARQVTARALAALDARAGRQPVEETPEVVERGRRRISHLQATDPEGAWVAEVDGQVVGCSMALVREGMWFLSLLMVDPEHHSKGLGTQLLEAAMKTVTDRSWLLATVDPKALRCYQRAGFDLHAAYEARGPVDRAALPAQSGIREGSYDADRDLLIALSRSMRGASLEPELTFLQERGLRFLVAPGEGFVFLYPGGVTWLGASNEDAARKLLWSAIAEAGDQVTVDWLAANQQWAIDVCMEARLVLRAGASIGLRGQPTMSPYLPSGAFG